MSSTAVITWDTSLFDLSDASIDVEERILLFLDWTQGLSELGMGWVADRDTWSWLASIDAPYEGSGFQALLDERGIAHLSGRDLYNLFVRLIEQGDTQARNDIPDVLGDIPETLATDFDHDPCHLGTHTDQAIHCYVLAAVSSVFSEVPSLGLVSCAYPWPTSDDSVAVEIVDIEPDTEPSLIGTTIGATVRFLTRIEDLYALEPDPALVTSSSESHRIRLAAILAARRLQIDAGHAADVSPSDFSFHAGFAQSARSASALSNRSAQTQLIRSIAAAMAGDHGDGEHRVKTGTGGNDPDLEWNGRHLLRREVSRGAGRRLHYWEPPAGEVGLHFASVTTHDDYDFPWPDDEV